MPINPIRPTHQSSRQLRLEHPFVFISYAKEDRDKVLAIYRKLERRNLKPWLDEYYLRPGCDWKMVVEETIRNCRFCLVLLSSKSVNKKGFVQKEISMALDVAEEIPKKDMFIIPVRLEDCEVPLRLKKWQWVDIYKRGGYNRLEKTLIESLGKDYSPPLKGIPKKLDYKLTFKDSYEHLLFDLFLEQRTFYFCRMGKHNYAISDYRFLEFRKDLPNYHRYLKNLVSNYKELSKETVQRIIPKKSKYKKTSNLLDHLKIWDRRTFQLFARNKKIRALIDKRFWNLISVKLANPQVYIVGPVNPIYVEENNKLQFIVMPIRQD